MQHEKLLSYVTNKFGIQYFDFSESKQFHLKDFKNDNHLNPDGAKIFTVIIDSLLNHQTPLPL
jgi:hypothetical protein